MMKPTLEVLMILANEHLTLRIEREAAEMHSLVDHATGKEILWNGDPAYWSGRNPILFPIVGSTFDKLIHLFGETTTMGNHGFARHRVFKIVDQHETSLTLALESDESTLAQYPFAFTLSVTTSLKGRSVHLDYVITNRDEKPMPFSFGLHPAFALSDPNGGIIEFPKAEHHPLIPQPNTRITMDDVFFDEHKTFLITQPQSPYVDLIQPDYRVRVSCEGYPWLAFWKKANAKFLCIEPWHGHTDYEETTTDFYAREGTIVLQPGESFKTNYSIQILITNAR
jgi:galactose mutarotase-like enzyme